MDREETAMRIRSDLRKTDELELAPETLKDLTPSKAQSGDVRGGATTGYRACECGTW